MLGRAGLVLRRPAARVLSSQRWELCAVLGRGMAYSNENKPETKEAANEALADAKAGKTASEVKQHKATTGNQPLARESGAAGAKAAHDNAVTHTHTHTHTHTLRHTTWHTGHSSRPPATHNVLCAPLTRAVHRRAAVSR